MWCDFINDEAGHTGMHNVKVTQGHQQCAYPLSVDDFL